jgi:hypothetical protein
MPTITLATWNAILHVVETATPHAMVIIYNDYVQIGGFDIHQCRYTPSEHKHDFK